VQLSRAIESEARAAEDAFRAVCQRVHEELQELKRECDTSSRSGSSSGWSSRRSSGTGEANNSSGAAQVCGDNAPLPVLAQQQQQQQQAEQQDRHTSSQIAGPTRLQQSNDAAAADDDVADATVRVEVYRPKRPDTPAAAALMKPCGGHAAAPAAVSNHGDNADTVQPAEQARCKTPEPAPTGFKLWGKHKTAAAAKHAKGQQLAAATQQKQQQKQGHSAKSWAKGVTQQLSKISKLWACGQSALAQVDVSAAGGVQEAAAAWSPVREALPIVAGC
jgi:hypothetical protein